MARMRKGQFYIIAAYLIIVIVAGVAAAYVNYYHRAEQKVEETGIAESVFGEISREMVYVVRMDPGNDSRISDFSQYAEWYAGSKALDLNLSHSTGPLAGYCDAYYNCTTDCTNSTVVRIVLRNDFKELARNVSVCWK